MTKAKTARGLIAGLLVSMALVGCTNTPIAESTNANANAANAANAGKDANANASGVNGANSISNKVAPVEVKTANATGVQPAASVSRLVYFAFDSYVISDEFAAVIEANANFLKANRGSRVSIEGNTDELGSREYNIALGQQRAEAVRRALSLLGVQEGQMEAVSFGEEKPAVPGGDAQSRAQNRRAFINYR
jgi:peptidoglycan-associated lipoprotein